MAKKKAHLKRPSSRVRASVKSSARSAPKKAAPQTAAYADRLIKLMPALRAGEKNRGILFDNTGRPVAWLIEHEKEIEGTHAELTKMAADLGAEYQLPDRQEAALCYANGKADHQQRYYWTREQRPGYSACAYVQDFADGYQGIGRKDGRYWGRAVRRVAI